MSDQYRSAEIGILFGALAKAQGAYLRPVPNQRSPGGEFANLASILEATRPALSANALSFNFYQELLDSGSGACILWTTLGHESGQWMKSCSRVVSSGTFREIFNAIENYKRLSACNMLGIAPAGKDPLLFDDDGIEELDKQTVKNMRTPIDKRPKKSEHADVITQDQYDDLMFELEGYEEIAENMQQVYRIKTIADLPRSELYFAKEKIRELKKTYDDYDSKNK